MKRLAFALCLAAIPAVGHAQINVGKQGQLTGIAMGCPDKSDTAAFIDNLGKANAANDTVGESEAVQTAVSAGCQTFQAGQTGLIIDWTGIFEQYGEIRFDDSPTAYWFPGQMITPVSQ